MKKSVAFVLILVMIVITAFVLIFINKNSDAPLDDYPPCVYIQDNVYITAGNAVTTLPSDVILLGEIKKTVYVQLETTEENKYSIYKTTE